MANVGALDPRKTNRAVFALLCVTVLWGWTFVWMKQAIDAARETLGAGGVATGIGLFMALRFGLAAIAMLALPAVRSGLTRGAWRGGLWIGLALLGGFLLQMFGLSGVSPAVSAFLTSLYVLFTALLTSIRDRRPPHVGLIVGALLATFGAGFIGGPPPQIASWFGANPGASSAGLGTAEGLTILCAFVFAVHILVTDAWTKREKPMPVTFTSFVVVAIGGTATLAISWWLDGARDGAVLLTLLARPDFWQPLVFSSLLATVLALSLMNVYQRDLDPVRAAIVYAIEPVWAALVGIGLGLDHATAWLYVGGGALLAGNLIAELVPLWMRRRRAV